MYSTNALSKGWWEKVNIIVWGESAKLIAEDDQIQLEVQKMLTAGVTIEACRACADRYGVSRILEKLELDVKYMEEPLTEIIKKGENLITL
ncbi:DsrE family protein [Ancylomarina sp. 16SWW S1-10-2]|uniref:DsrE family protein n=1 Tax=Ancylomarina sp. 16SWW S1-10-2 TaxID=2499681 RepID=UPI001E5A533B|nr:DsrE family protein [Ancylomarina sp. 16SWW S1-10-2]